MNTGEAGNFGLSDINIALNWINQNIAQFGGNTENILIIGETAGAMLAHALTVSAQNWIEPMKFKSVALQSGTISLKKMDKGYDYRESVYNQTECSDITCLKNMDAFELVNLDTVQKTTLTIDGAILVNDYEIMQEQAFERGNAADFRYLIGFNGNEGTFGLNEIKDNTPTSLQCSEFYKAFKKVLAGKLPDLEEHVVKAVYMKYVDYSTREIIFDGQKLVYFDEFTRVVYLLA